MSTTNTSVYKADTKLIPLMESFLTIQGEGFHQGKGAYFIRLAGCDVGCHWCDVKESWEAEGYPELSPETIANEAADSNAEITVITGGEPLMYDLSELTAALQKKNFKTHIETSGAYPLSGNWDWICLSPKKLKAPLKEVTEQADELKVVIYNKSDFKWAEKYAALVSDECKLYLQPEWSKKEEMLPLIIDHVHQNPEWRISLQVHKYMGIP